MDRIITQIEADTKESIKPFLARSVHLQRLEDKRQEQNFKNIFVDKLDVLKGKITKLRAQREIA
jgi:hypothetical protein